MTRFSLAVLTCAAVAVPTVAAAEAPPIAGESWAWPTVRTWLEATPTSVDTAGKVVVHWFCAPKVEACRDDLARLFNMREQGNVYVIAYIAGTKRDAAKLDPVRSEVGGGAVAYGPQVTRLMKGFGFTSPTSIVIDTDNKVALVSRGGGPDALDQRDQKVSALVGSIREYQLKNHCPAQAKVGERFELAVEVDLAGWLSYDQSVKPVVKLTVPPDVTCESTQLKADQVKVEGRKLVAKVGCTGAVKGSYEARAALRFSYRTPGKAVGVGEEDVSFKFQVVK